MIVQLQTSRRVVLSSIHYSPVTVLHIAVQEQLLVPENLRSLDELSFEHRFPADHNSGHQLHGLQVG